MSDAKHALEALLKTASAELGVPLELTDDNECIISRADGQELVLGAEDGDDMIWIFSPLIEAGHDAREQLFAWCLQENVVQEHTKGAVIGFDVNTNRFLLSHRVHMSIASDGRLGQILSNLFDLTDTISRVISEKQSELAHVSGASSTQSSENQQSGPTHHGFA